MVPVHRPVAAAERGDAPHTGLRDQVLNPGQVGGRAGGRGVATIGDHVHTYVLDPPGCSPLQQSAQVIDMAVHPAIGAETHQVQTATIGQQPIGQGIEGGIAAERAVPNGLADSYQFLADDPAGADGEMANLGIAHLIVGQAHR